MTLRTLVSVLCAGLLTTGCLDALRQSGPTNPSNVSMQLFGGAWGSVSSTSPILESCTDFKWSVTEVSGTSASGTFSATCYGNLKITGTARGMLSGTTVSWTATATGATPNLPACPISLTGTATIDGSQIRIPYSGTTCLGPVSGTEILRKS